MSFGKNSTGVLEIVDSNDYYPFGMNHLKTGNAYFGQDSFKKYKYKLAFILSQDQTLHCMFV
ncbi:hypothetical protein EU348_15970 [Chryseobacterium indologenes]|uniref:Uncharacterized protein n=1 Tax=Chryseobacterium indologenes TaxID=253 RepID=A0A411DQI6_CHRID|nr:hypothetical protein EU348_15970 [Chryseobacterium indologenes]